MERAVGASLASAAKRLTLLAVSLALVSGCSMGSTPRRNAPPASDTTTSTTSRPTTTTTLAPITYRMKRGDVLSAVASRFRVSVAAIVKRNHIANPDRVAEGRVLVIPPAPPLTFVVRPARGAAGQAFRFVLNGARPSETIRFEIESPAGKYRGGLHVTSASGTVRATYQTAVGDIAGIRNVTATGDMGTTVRATFRVTAAPGQQ